METPDSRVQIDQLKDEEQQLQQAIKLFLEFFEREPNAIRTFEDIFDQHLRGQINPDTGGLIFKSITLYAGADNAKFLWRFMQRAFDEPEYCARVEALFTEKVRTCMRSFLARYGSDFREVYALQDENPNSWRFLRRRVYYNFTEERWEVALRIYKYSGEVTLYEEPLRGWVNLANSILSILNEIPLEAAKGHIDHDTLEKFKSTYTTFIESFTAEPTNNSDEEGNHENTENN